LELPFGNLLSLSGFQNQWGTLTITKSSNEYYNGPLSSVFSEDQLKSELEAHIQNYGRANIPLNTNFQQNLPHLITINYQYVRLAFNPIVEQFHVIGCVKIHLL
jgi:hypothetical protein